MNIDELRNQWNEDDRFLNISEKQLQSQAKHPLDKLKKTLKTECLVQLASIVIMGFTPIIFNFNSLYLNVFFVFYSILVFISAYYFKGFYDFHQRLNTFDINTHQSLLIIYYDLKLQIERYKSFGFLLIPLLWVFILLFFLEKSPSFLSSSDIYLIMGLAIFTSILTLISVVLWAEWVYGKIAKKLLSILEQFNE
jgi:hypothetical protein